MTYQPLSVRTIGDPILHRPCAPVEYFGDELVALVQSMFATMDAAGGDGLAANQVGAGLRVFVYDSFDRYGERHRSHVINPVVVTPGPYERYLDSAEEGCLSIPGAHAPLHRPDEAVVLGHDVLERPVVVNATGPLARCVQHQADHLNGHLYTDLLHARLRERVLLAHQNTG